MPEKRDNPGNTSIGTLEGDPIYTHVSASPKVRLSEAIDLRVFWDRRRTLLRWVVGGFVLSAIISFVIPRKFESTAQLMPPDQTNSGMALLAAATGGKSGLGGGSGMGSGIESMAGDLLGLKSSGEVFVGVLHSRTIEDDLINKFDLRKIYRDRYTEDARKDLDSNTDVTEDRKSGIITIMVRDKSPERAEALAQEYVSELNKIVVSLNTSSAHREREFLEGRLVQVKDDLESAENGFSQFASTNTALDIPTQGKAMIEANAELEGELIGAQTELEGLKQIYADGNVRVRSLQARVDELRHEMEKIGGKFDSTTVPQGPNSDDSMYPSIRKLPLLGVKYADLFRNTKVQEAVFETLTQEYELAKVQEAKETPSVKVLDPPSFPEKKSFPPRMLITFLGTVFAFSVGVLWITANAFWARVDAQDPNKLLALEISQTTKAHLPWRSVNGAGSQTGWLRTHFPGKHDDAESRRK